MDRGQVQRDLWDRYGHPPRVDAGAALQLVGRTDIDPGTVVAFRYPSTEAADAWSAANREHWQVETLATVTTDGGVVSILDLRTASERAAAGNA